MGCNAAEPDATLPQTQGLWRTQLCLRMCATLNEAFDGAPEQKYYLFFESPHNSSRLDFHTAA